MRSFKIEFDWLYPMEGLTLIREKVTQWDGCNYETIVISSKDHWFNGDKLIPEEKAWAIMRQTALENLSEYPTSLDVHPGCWRENMLFKQITGYENLDDYLEED